MSNINPNCDGSHCTHKGEVRVYPLGGGANLILCQACFAHENAYRAGRGGKAKGFPGECWATAEVYPAEGAIAEPIQYGKRQGRVP